MYEADQIKGKRISIRQNQIQKLKALKKRKSDIF